MVKSTYKIIIFILALAILCPFVQTARAETKEEQKTSEQITQTQETIKEENQAENSEESNEPPAPPTPAPIPKPHQSGILIEIDAKDTDGKIYSSSFISHDPNGYIENSACVIETDDNLTTAFSNPILKSNASFFIKADITSKPENSVSSADKFLNDLDKLINSTPGLKYRIKGIILNATPDIDGSPWKGYEEELFVYYSMIARGIKEKYNDTFQIGGLGFTAAFEGDGEYKDTSPVLKNFLDFLSRRNVPCDIMYLNSGSLTPYNYFLETAYLKSKVFPEYESKINRLKIYVSINNDLSLIDDWNMKQTTAIQNLICAIKAKADFLELPTFISEGNLNEALESSFSDDYAFLINAKGMDRLSFLIHSAKPDDSSIFLILAASNPSDWILNSNQSEIKDRIEKEYRNIAHKFTDGIYSPEYSRFRLSLTNCPWSGKDVKMERFELTSEGTLNKIEEQNLDGRNEYFFNKAIKTPVVMLIKITALEPPKQEEEINGEGEDKENGDSDNTIEGEVKETENNRVN